MNPYKKEQREQEKKTWKSLTGKQKLRQAFDYYRLPFFIVLLVLCTAGYVYYQYATRKETVLYAALVNLRPDENITDVLSDGFIPFYEEATGKSSVKRSVFLYVDLHLAAADSGDYNQQEYSSQLRLMSAVQSRQLDVVLMDQQAFHTLSQDRYLADLNSCLSEYPGLLASLSPLLTDSTVISGEITDNSTAQISSTHSGSSEPSADSPVPFDSPAQSADSSAHSGGSEPYADSSTLSDSSAHFSDSPALAIDVTHAAVFQEAGYPGNIYLGVIDSSPRKSTASSYIRYLLAENL